MLKKKNKIKFYIPLVLSFVLLSGCGNIEEKEITTTKEEVFVMEKNITQANITILDVYDNVEFNPDFKTGFGFACVVKLKDKTILFDTGGDSQTLLSNLETANIKPEDIDIILLSHIHGDHVGGLLGFLEKNPNVKVYVPASFPSSFKNQIASTGAELIDVSNPVKIIEGVYSTGELGTWIKEQSLVIDSDKGLVVITGCAHPGIVNIVRKAKDMFNKKLYLVLGGFHLSAAGDSELKNIIKSFRELEVEKTAPSHCTGERARELFKQEYKDNFIENGVGKEIRI